MTFLLRKNSHVDGPSADNIKITFENLCQEFHGSVYENGIDPETATVLIHDLYKWLVGLSDSSPIRLPAPVDDVGDKHRVMWPEGSTIRTRSRRDSHTSKSSASKGVSDLNRTYTSSRASSVVSSRYAPVRNKFVDDPRPEDGVRSLNLRDLKEHQIATTPSLEQIKDHVHKRSRRVVHDQPQADIRPSFAGMVADPEPRHRSSRKAPAVFAEDQE